MKEKQIHEKIIIHSKQIHTDIIRDFPEPERIFRNFRRNILCSKNQETNLQHTNKILSLKMYILNSQFCSKLILQNCSRIILEWTKFFSSTTVKVNMGPAFILSVYKNLRRLFCVNYLFLFFFNSSLILFLFAFQTFNIVQYSGTNIFYMAQEIHFFWHKGPFSLKRKMFVLFSF